MNEHLRVVLDTSFELAEGPIWWRRENALVWVNILHGDVYAFRDDWEAPERWGLPASVGCVVEMPNGQLLAASAAGLVDVCSGDLLAQPPFDGEKLRPNDGKLDPYGNLVYGVMRYPDSVAGEGFLTRFRNGTHELLLDGLEIPNGMVWLSSSELLFIDTPTRRIDRYRYFEEKPPEFIDVYADLSNFNGFPDGMCLDDTGSLYIAMWDGSQILKIDENGCISRVGLPIERPTSVCQKPNTRTFYVTSAKASDGSGGCILAIEM